MSAIVESRSGWAPGPGHGGEQRARHMQLTAVAIALLGFLAATNRYVSTSEDIHRLHDTDSLSYRAMAHAAPGLLHRRIPEWHAERFAVQWVIGSLAKLVHLGLTPAYFIAVALVIVAICLVLVDLLERIGVSGRAGSVCLALFVLNPYTLRSYLLGPAGVGDLVLVLGVTIAVRGLVLRSPVGVLGGLLLGTLARQTAVPAALVAAAAGVLDPLWLARLGRRRVPFAVAVVALPAACYAIIRIVAHPFSGPSPSLNVMTLLGAPRSVHALAEHFARSVFPLLAVSALLLSSWWILRPAARRRVGRGDPERQSAGDGRGDVYDLAAFVAQSMALNPVWVSDNEPRLSALAIVPLAVAVALSLRALERARGTALPRKVAAAALALLAIGSFHHIYTWLRLADVGETVALQVCVALALTVVMVKWAKRSAGAPSPGGDISP